MVTSREEFLGSAMDRTASMLDDFRARIEKELRAAKARGETTFSVDIPDSLLSHPLTDIIAEYQNPEAGWTVKREKIGNTTTLDFS